MSREQNVVNSPGIHAHRLDFLPASACRDSQAALDFRPQPQYVPVQRVAYFYGAVWKAMQLLQPDAFAVPEPRRHAPAFGSEVHAQITLSLHRIVGPASCLSLARKSN